MNVPDPIVITVVTLAGSALVVLGYIFKKLMEHERRRGRTEAMLELMEKNQSLRRRKQSK